MRKYVECYLNTLVGLEPEAVNKSIASMVKKALVNTTQERAEYFVNGLTFVNKQDPNSATSEGYLLNLLQDLTGLEKETLKGAVERNRDLLKMHTELIIYTGKLVVFGNDMDRMIDTYFEEAAPNLDIPSIILINKTLKEVDIDCVTILVPIHLYRSMVRNSCPSNIVRGLRLMQPLDLQYEEG